MQITQLVIIEQSDILDAFRKAYEMAEIQKTDSYTLYEGKKVWQDPETQFLFLIGTDMKKSLKYISEHYDVFKIVIAGVAKNLWNIDIKTWDVVLPNSFISTSWDGSLFLEYAIGENYDLEKFQVILNGICATWEVTNMEEDDFYADIQDNRVFEILQSLDQQSFLKQAVVVKEIIETPGSSLQNLVNITDFILL